MNNNTEQISRYLQNEMSGEERIAFEKQLSADKELQQEFSIQQQIIKAAGTAGLKNEFSKAIRKKIFTQRLVQWGIPATLLVAAFVFYAIKTNIFSRHSAKENTERAEQFVISNAADTIIETRDGLVFAIPAHAFNSESSTIRLEIKTALNTYDIMRQGLSTVSNGALLQTAGMFYMNGYDGDQPVSLVKNIDVSVPAREINPAMQLFDGVEDSSGHINWVNPKPIEKKLRTYDITTLNFYPQNYLPTLKALQKNYRDKRYTDSLYYSFSGYPYTTVDMTEGPNEINFADIMVSDSDPAGNGDDVGIGSADDYEKQDTVREVVIQKDRAYYKTDSTIKPNRDTTALKDTVYYHYEIDPARIKAIWDKKFNNTILATKEFEERLRYIHTLCDPAYLDAYLSGLDKPLFEIDQLCAANSSGEVKKKFLEFAARKDGAVIIAEGMQEKLSIYFQQKFQAYREAEIKTRAKYEAELLQLNNITDIKRKEEGLREFSRKTKNFEEEFCVNLAESYKQIGIKRSCNDTIVPPTTPYYNIIISTTGWKNLDIYVFDATESREDMRYTDPNTGKTTTLTYSEVTIQVENQSEFDRVLVYLIPDNLSSFQRVRQQGNVFKEKLNSLFRYDAIVLAYKGTDAYYYRQQSLQPAVYSFHLSPIGKEGLDLIMKEYSVDKRTSFRTEFEYQLFEQQEAIRQLQLRKDMQFREQVAASIFHCAVVAEAPVNITRPSSPK